MQKSRSCEPIAWHEMWHERSVLCLHDGSSGVGKARARGNIETLRSGALRVRVYAGLAPVTKKRHNLIEVVPPGPKAMRKAEAIRDRLLHEVAEKRNPRTSATVDQLLDRYLEQRRVALDGETAAVLREHLARCRSKASALGLDLPEGAFVFSGSPDGSTFARPD
jgi:hypothetical protein